MKTQQPVGLERLDPPEVDRVADAKPHGITPSSTQAGPTDEHVEEPSCAPEERPLVPPHLATDPLDGSERSLGPERHNRRARVH